MQAAVPQREKWKKADRTGLLIVKETVIVFTQLMQHTRAGLGLEIFLGYLIRRGFLYSDFSKLKTTALYSDVNVCFSYLHFPNWFQTPWLFFCNFLL